MYELLLKIQDACLQLNWWYLVVPGLGAIILGLFLWLGGSRYAFIVVGVLGALVGAGCGFVVSQWFNLHMSLTVSVGAAIFTVTAILLQQTVMVLLASAIFAAACGLAYMSYSLDKPDFQEALHRLGRQSADSSQSFRPDSDLSSSATTDDQRLPLPLGSFDAAGDLAPHQQGMERLKGIFGALRSSAASNRNMIFLWAVVGGLGGLLIGYLLKKIVMALCCSIVGAAGVIIGMLVLLMAKGIPVFSSLEDRPRLLVSIFAAMVLFGCPLQLLATGRAKKKSPTSEKKEEKRS